MSFASEAEYRAQIEADLNALTGEYHEWLATNNLTDLGSADEHLFDERLTDAQRAWIRDFSRRWEDAAPIFANGQWTTRRDMEGRQ